MRIVRLIYRSEQSAVMNLAELIGLSNLSSQNNARQDIDGILIMSSGHFLQVLEGPEGAVNRLYAKICRDPRHHKQQLLSIAIIQSKAFGQWRMRAVSLDGINDSGMAWLGRKYGLVEDGVAVPEDPQMAFSLLFDVYHLPSPHEARELPSA